MRDLDLLDDATLQRDLEAELDDIYADFDPNGEFPLEELKAAMLEALSDGGDEGVEDEIDFEDLEADMEEADTTIEDVLDMALAEADAIASSRAADVVDRSSRPQPKFRGSAARQRPNDAEAGDAASRADVHPLLEREVTTDRSTDLP